MGTYLTSGLLVAFVAIGSVIIPTCSRPREVGSQVRHEVVEMAISESRPATETIRQVREAKRNKPKEPGWLVTKVGLPFKSRARKVFFLNRYIGWVCNGNELLQTDDRGLTWKRLTKKVACGDDRSELFFDTVRTGWLTEEVRRPGSNFLSKEVKIQLYVTSDGGANWTLVLSRGVASNLQTAFLGPGVWITGLDHTSLDFYETKPFLLVADSYGESTEFRIPSSIVTENDTSQWFYEFEKLGISDNDCILIVTRNRSFLRTCDEGKTWNMYSGFPFDEEDRHPLGATGLGETAAGVIWVMEAAGGVEGTGSTFSLFDTEKSLVESVSFGGLYARFAVKTLENELHIVGEDLMTRLDESSGKLNVAEEIVVLSGSFGSNEFQEVYRHRKFGRTVHVSEGGDGSVWFIDSEGDLYSVEKKKRTP